MARPFKTLWPASSCCIPAVQVVEVKDKESEAPGAGCIRREQVENFKAGESFEDFANQLCASGPSHQTLNVRRQRAIWRACAYYYENDKAVLHHEVQKHLKALRHDPARESRELAKAWRRPIAHNAFSMAKLVVLAAAEKHEINLYKMTHQNKKQLASAIDELLKAERERNREGRPPTHFIFRELVWELVIILFKEHGRRTNWIGFNRAGENHKKRKRGQIYGPLFDSVKAAIGEVLGLKVAIDEDQAKAMKGQLALEQGASDNEDLEPCSEKDERPRFSDEAVAEIIRASLRDAKAQLENPSPWLPAELHTELSAALGNLVG